jgi:outer membrane protein assembly factor BamB
MMKICRIVGLAAALCALPARGDDWSGLGRDDARSRAASELIVSPAALGAPVATGSDSVASPAAADGYLVTAGLNGIVRAFRESDRSLVWSRTLGGAIFAAPLIDRGRVYVSSSKRDDVGAPAGGRRTLWTSSTGSADQSSPVISGGKLFLGGASRTPRSPRWM